MTLFSEHDNRVQHTAQHFNVEQCVALDCAIECYTRVQHTAQLVNVLLSRVIVEQSVAVDCQLS